MNPFRKKPKTDPGIEGVGPVQIIHSRRKTIALIVEHDGRVVVRAPYRLPHHLIEAFVFEKAGWIQQKRAELARREGVCGRPAGAARKFEAGEDFLFLGRSYPLQIVEHQAEGLALDEAFRLKRSALPGAAQVFERWYKIQARALFTRRVDELARQHGFTVRELRLSSARTRWGSCGAKGTLNLNWRLVMAPAAVIDYVILHELAHLKEKNHSLRFWALVEKLAPDYKIQRQWLKANGACLGWP
jgi:predicted metal-dependent hydrolase